MGRSRKEGQDLWALESQAVLRGKRLGVGNLRPSSAGPKQRSTTPAPKSHCSDGAGTCASYERGTTLVPMRAPVVPSSETATHGQVTQG